MTKVTKLTDQIDDFGIALNNALQSFIDTESKKLIERHEKELLKELEQLRIEMVQRAVIAISPYTEIHYLRDRIVLEVINNEARNVQGR